MPDQNGEKTQDATPHRRQKAREEGQVAKSQDLASAVLLVGGMLALLYLGGRVVDFFIRHMQRQLGGEAWLGADSAFAVAYFHATAWELAKVLLPILGVVFGLALGVNLAQIGFLFLPQRVAPDITRIDPLKGLKRIFSASGAVRLGLGIIKIMIIAIVAAWSLYDKRAAVLAMVELSIPQIAANLMNLLLWTAVNIGIVLVILALIDYAFQRWKHEQDIKMTNEEVRDEMRNLQGDPQIIARRRAVQRQLVLNRLSSAVPKADVVVTNPTELAVAIQYDMEKMAAPIVVAKGAGIVARRIRELALKSGIPIVERKPLARTLYKEVELNHPIPNELYAAVAELLAYVYQLQGKPMPEPPGASAA